MKLNKEWTGFIEGGTDARRDEIVESLRAKHGDNITIVLNSDGYGAWSYWTIRWHPNWRKLYGN